MPPSSAPEVTFASVVEGISRPSEPESPHIQVWRDEQGEIFALCYESRDRHWICWPGLAGYCLDVGSNRVAVHPEPDADRSVVLDTYRRSVLPIVQHVLGRESLHASAILGPGGVVAFCGRSMSGKSTLAYGFSERGFALCADDSVVLEASGEAVEVVPFAFGLRLRPAALSHFGLIAEDAAQQACEKMGLEAERPRAPLAAVFVLEPLLDEGNEVYPEVERLKGHEALVSLLPHARCFSLKDRKRKREMLRNFMMLADRVPVFLVRYVPGLERLPGLLDRIEAAFGSNRTA